MTSISILVPAYNERESILAVLTQIQDQSVQGFEYEVIVVDDGSTDGTGDLLEQNPDLYNVLIRQPENRGKGAAVKAGLKKATGDYILFQDADLEYDPSDYYKLFLPISRFEADLVMGSRMVAPEYTRVSYFWNKVGNRVITLAFNVLNNTTFTDIYSCYLMYRRGLVDPDSLVSEGWEQHAEILSIATKNAKNMYEVPVSYHGRTHEEGKKIRAHHAIAVILMIMKMRLFGSKSTS